MQLANASEKSCGAGAQLAFQHARGEYFYLLDGDMVLDPDFLPKAIARMEDKPALAGVGGLVTEKNTESLGFKIRAEAVAKDANWRPGSVDRLDCGGLYRSAAIREAGYFADRNLHAFEEFELAARLRARGWELERIDQHAVDHYGHLTGGYRLLWRRIQTGYSGAVGEVLRGAIGQRHLPVVMRRFSHVKFGLAVMVWWLSLLVALLLPVPPLARFCILLLLLVLPLGLLIWRRRSLSLGLYSAAAWNVAAWGLISGFFRARAAPTTPLRSIVVADPPMARSERSSYQ